MLYFIIAAGIILQALFIKTEHDQKYVAADILKGSAAGDRPDSLRFQHHYRRIATDGPETSTLPPSSIRC